MKDTLLTKAEFSARRAAFFKSMPSKGIAIFAAGGEVTRSNDTQFLFCQDKHFYYLTGFNEPDALLVLVKDSEQDCQSILFCQDKDPLLEVWHGRRYGAEQAKTDYGFDQTYPLSQCDEKLPALLENKASLHYLINESAAFEQRLQGWLKTVNRLNRAGITAPTSFIHCAEQINELRLIKSEAELNIMRQANIISGQAHQRAMQKTKPGLFEYQIEAELLHEFSYNGARFAAYNSIVASGDNANILHYTANNAPLVDKQLLLIDAGAELAGYAADITRTFPINGVFSPEQKAIYQLVLEAQHQAISIIKPGCTFAALNLLTCNILTQGLYNLGILRGDLATLIKDKACKKYFIHGIGHWLGLDVHDVGNYQCNHHKEQLRAFSPGMVLTIEPGLYIPEDEQSVEEKWRGIAVRIEDNIAVTDNGYENLTSNTPKEVADIEALMASSDPVTIND